MPEGAWLPEIAFAGLVAAWVFYGFTPHKKPAPFERIAQALIYSAIIGLAARPLTGFMPSDAAFALLLLSVCAGFGFAVAANCARLTGPEDIVMSKAQRNKPKAEWRPRIPQQFRRHNYDPPPAVRPPPPDWAIRRGRGC